MIVENIIQFGKVLGVFAAVIVATKKTKQYFLPLKVVGGTRLVYDGTSPGEILASVINKSSNPIYLQSCKAREVKNIKRLLLERIRTELAHRSKNHHDEYDIKTYDLLKKKPLKIEPSELVDLNHKLNFNHPFAGFFNRQFIIEATLTNGSIIKSRRITVPEAWMFRIKNNHL